MGVLPVVHIHDGTGVVEPFDFGDGVWVVSGFAPGEEPAAVQHRMIQTQVDQLRDEGEQALAIIIQIPMRPGDLVVLAVGVVVALLGAGNLVASADHGDALADQQCGEHVAHLPLAQFVDVADGGFPFHTAVPRTVIAFAVAVAFAVGVVVLLVVAHQIVEGEAIMRGDEVHRGDRSTTVHFIQVGAAHQT